MNATAEEWIAKAEGDYRTAQREHAVEAEPNLDAVCYHAQQCIEKLMKAVLIIEGVTPPRTHDLMDLSARVSAALPAWAWPDAELRFLTRAAVDFR